MKNQLLYRGQSAEGNAMSKSDNLVQITELAKRNLKRCGMEARVFRSDGSEIRNFLIVIEAETYL